MDMLKYKDIIEEGDLVIVYLNVSQMYPLTLVHGQIFQSKYGALKHSDAIGKKFGSKVNCSQGYVYVLFPTTELWTSILPHRTQILYSTDISLIILHLDLRPGSVVCEAGTGSGSLSHALARTIVPNGFLYTFDFHKERVDVAEKEFESHGLSKVVRVAHRDVSTAGFGIKHEADAVVLDLPQPWEVIPYLKEAVKLNGGRICSFSPCVEQVQRTCLSLQEHDFQDINTVECLQRQFEVKKVFLPDLKPMSYCKSKRKSPNSSPKNQETTTHSKPMEVETLGTSSSDSKDNSSLEKQSVAHQITKMNENTAASGSLKETPVFNDVFWTASPPLQAPGHTGYLTFATLDRQVVQNEKDC